MSSALPASDTAIIARSASTGQARADARRHGLLLAGVIVAITAGLLLKSARYLADAHPAADATIAGIQRLMADQGWQVLAAEAGRDGMPTTVLPFRKGGCARPAIVTLFGANAEMHRYFTKAFDGDVVFLQHGRLVSEPGRAADGVAQMALIMSQLARGRVEPGLPILAIAPRPGAGTCTPPDESVWRELPAEIDPSLRQPIL